MTFEEFLMMYYGLTFEEYERDYNDLDLMVCCHYDHILDDPDWSWYSDDNTTHTYS